MKLMICTERDKDYEWYIRQAQASGHDVYVDEQRGEYFIKIGEDRTWRAPDAVFQPVESGLYVFENGKPKKVE